MKNFITFLAAALALLICAVSCKNEPFSFEYSFNIDGHANGDASVMFPGGELAVKGDSELQFSYNSASFELLRKGAPLYTVQDLREIGKKNYSKVASLAEDRYEAKFKATSTSGTYYFHIVGVVHEKLTGLDIKIDKVLTNEPSGELVP